MLLVIFLLDDLPQKSKKEEPKKSKKHKNKDGESVKKSKKGKRDAKKSKKKKKRVSSSDSSDSSDSRSDSSSGSDSSDSDSDQYAGAFKKNKKADKKSKKKSKKSHKKKKVKSMNDMWGRHGTIKEEDRHAKAAEFFTWLYEVKNIDRSNLNHKEEREYFREYAEDYNTGTFPNEKYYNLAKWQASLPAKPEGAYLDDPTLTDEERVRLARRDRKDSANKQLEDARVQAMLDSMRQAKADKDSGYHDIVDRHMERIKPATFESLAKERRRRKRDDHVQED